MIPVIGPRAIIGSQDHQRIIFQAQLTQCLEYLTYTPVDLHHHVAI